MGFLDRVNMAGATGNNTAKSKTQAAQNEA